MHDLFIIYDSQFGSPPSLSRIASSAALPDADATSKSNQRVFIAIAWIFRVSFSFLPASFMRLAEGMHQQDVQDSQDSQDVRLSRATLAALLAN